MRLTRRAFLSGSAAVVLSAAAGLTQQRRLFDSHCHVIDHRFPIVANQGYTPPNFPLEDYLAKVKPLGVAGDDDQPEPGVVPPGRPYKSVKELVAAAKEANGKMTFASIGVGSIPQFLGVLFQLRAGVSLVDVPYKGAVPAAVDLIGGRIDMAFLNVPAVLPQVQSGQLRALAIADATRAKALPDTPTMADAGYPSVAMSTWYGISAPAKTPRAVVDKLYAAIAQTLNSPKAREKIEAQGAEVFVKSPDDYAAYLQADAKLMLELIKAANMTAN